MANHALPIWKLRGSTLWASGIGLRDSWSALIHVFTLQKEVPCKAIDLSLVFTLNCIKIGIFSLPIHAPFQDDKHFKKDL